MARRRSDHTITLSQKYPPSKPCSCEVCVSYCKRPGWWTVHEATLAIDAGFSHQMMLEMSPDKTYGVLSPAFRGCEQNFALERYANQGCTFLIDKLCELHGTEFQPLECRYCHHERIGLGEQCHADIGQDWNTSKGRGLIVHWSKITGFWEHHVILK